MKKAFIILSTIGCCSFLWDLPVINFDDQGFRFHQCALHHCHWHGAHFSQESIAFGTAMGKVIKEKHLTENAYQIKTIVIDPGHGGFDSGCLGDNSKEKHIALGIAKKLRNKIKANYTGVNIIMTRDKDYFVPLHKRAHIANQNKADLFISIHANAMSNADYIRGSETYVLGLHKVEENLNVAKRENASVLLEDNYEENYDFDPNSAEGHIMLSMYQNAYLENSILLAQRVEERMASDARRKSRGVKQAGFIVLHQTAMPSVLVETGFLTNNNEEAYLMTEQGQQRIAQAIYTAFGDYKKEVESGIESVEHKPVVLNDKPHLPIKKSVKSTAPARANIPKSTPPVLEEPFPDDDEKPMSTQAKIQYRVQVAASPKPLDLKRGKWKKAENFLIEVVREDNLYKYQARGFEDLEKAKMAKRSLLQKGFTGAFIVPYRSGKKITMVEARGF